MVTVRIQQVLLHLLERLTLVLEELQLVGSLKIRELPEGYSLKLKGMLLLGVGKPSHQPLVRS